jgi:hypothetical protein
LTVTTFLQIVILLSVAAVAILVVYLIDRVNSLQRLTRLMQADQPAVSSVDEADGPFGDLSGQRLWEALAGVPTEGWDETAIELIRNRYGLVLRKHIEDLFHEGLMHARGGTQQIPSANRSVRTLRGMVDSWIPPEHAMTIYKAGWDRQTVPPESLASVRMSLDAAVAGLFSAVSIKLARPMSEHLIPADPAETAPQSLSDAPLLSSAAEPVARIGVATGEQAETPVAAAAGRPEQSGPTAVKALPLEGNTSPSPSAPGPQGRPAPGAPVPSATGSPPANVAAPPKSGAPSSS